MGMGFLNSQCVLLIVGIVVIMTFGQIALVWVMKKPFVIMVLVEKHVLKSIVGYLEISRHAMVQLPRLDVDIGCYQNVKFVVAITVCVLIALLLYQQM